MSTVAPPASAPWPPGTGRARTRRRPGTVAVARLPLPDALLVCLELLDADPERFEAAAVNLHARLSRHASRPRFADVGLALDALGALATPDWERGARDLERVCTRYGLDEVVDGPERWRLLAATASRDQLCARGERLGSKSS